MAYNVSWYPFSKHPNSDSCWSLSVGPDGRIYSAACSELTPGETVKLVRYNEYTDSLDYLLDIDQVIDDPRDSGRGTQCKIHYSFVPSMSNGILYMATHLSGAPFDLISYSPWFYWHDEKRCFRGSALVAFDTSNDQVLWWDTLIPKEGCRCLLHDEERGLLYMVGYPRDHLYVYNIKKKQRRDLGRIGSINTSVLLLDRKHRVWVTNDYGRFVRYDPEKDRLEPKMSPYKLPHNQAIQNGWHTVLYDAVASPDGQCIYAVPWTAYPHLMRIWLDEGEWGRVEDLGPVNQEYDNTLPVDTFIDHCGGLTFGGDGRLYYVGARWKEPLEANTTDTEGVVWCMDPQTMQREEVAVLKRPDGMCAHYVSRGAVDHNGDLFFGSVYHRAGLPVGIFKVHMPEERKKKDSHLPIRMWG